MRNSQKGQDLLEMALLLPLLFLFLFGIIYAGLFYGDYITISNIVRSAGREAAVTASGTYTPNKYKYVQDNYNANYFAEGQQNFHTHMYIFSPQALHIEKTELKDKNREGDKGDPSIDVWVEGQLRPDLGVTNLLINMGLTSINKPLRVEYLVYDEDPEK